LAKIEKRDHAVPGCVAAIIDVQLGICLRPADRRAMTALSSAANSNNPSDLRRASNDD
jgi:hypothetical protein